MVCKGIGPHSLQNRTSLCHQLGHFGRQISWYASLTVDVTGCNHLRGGYAIYMVEVVAVSHYLKQKLICCTFSTCLQLWQGKKIGYSWNSPTCAWPWEGPQWPKEGFRAPQWRNRNIWWRHLAPWSKKGWCGELTSLGIEMWTLA